MQPDVDLAATDRDSVNVGARRKEASISKERFDIEAEMSAGERNDLRARCGDCVQPLPSNCVFGQGGRIGLERHFDPVGAPVVGDVDTTAEVSVTGLVV